jgi:hypothetical protein
MRPNPFERFLWILGAVGVVIADGLFVAYGQLHGADTYPVHVAGFVGVVYCLRNAFR